MPISPPLTNQQTAPTENECRVWVGSGYHEDDNVLRPSWILSIGLFISLS